jgi:hypothetical protein
VAIENVVFYEAALQRLLNGPDGDVARDLSRRAIRVESQAKLNASGRPGPNVRTGRLRSSITWQLGRDTESIYADIGSAVEYAIYVERGTDRAPAYPFLKPALSAARY